MTDKKPKRQRKKPPKKPLAEQQIVTLGDIFPGFAEWYRSTYDANGNLLASGQVSGLGPVSENQENEKGPDN